MSWIITHFEIVLLTLLALLAGIVVLQQRRSPQSAAVWLLAIIVLPYFAIPLFLALGFRKRRRRVARIAFSNPDAGGTDEHASRASDHLRNFGVPVATGGNRFDLVAAPDAAYRDVLGLIATAESSLDVLFYIIADDDVGAAFFAALEERARAGVRVRVLLDWWGSLLRPRRALARLQQAGGEVRSFAPFLSRAPDGHLNLRNHRKMVIADGARVFAGGMNIGAEYMAPDQRPDQWADLAYSLEGPALRTFEDVFASNWAAAGGAPDRARKVVAQSPVAEATVQPVASGPDVVGDPMHDALVHAIHVATRRVWLVTPYFLPTEHLSHALSSAARRGVDVRILLPQRSNQHLTDFARGAYLREMQEAGCKVLFYQPGRIHAKAGLADDIAWVGSANFDIRSMLLNFEIVLFVFDAGSVDKLAAWFALQEAHSTAGVPSAGLIRRVLEGVFRLGAPVL